jgi:hypothetical protein
MSLLVLRSIKINKEVLLVEDKAAMAMISHSCGHCQYAITFTKRLEKA